MPKSLQNIVNRVSNTVGDARNAINQVREIPNRIQNEVERLSGGLLGGNAGAGQLLYPLDLNGPHISFTSKDRDGNTTNSIALYAPQSIVVSDGMGYGNYDLGILGSALKGAITDDGKNIDADKVKEKLDTSGFDQGTTKALFLKAVSNAGGGGPFVDKFASVSLKENKIALNPNTVLQFTGPNLRSYSFEFRLVAQSREESLVIKKIIDGFRNAMYPNKGEDSIVLEYPDVFAVRFNNTGGYIPNYADSYLTSMTTSYNASGNMYHDDGGPTDVNVSLQFSEFKALNRNDIEDLTNGVPVTLKTSDTTTPTTGTDT